MYSGLKAIGAELQYHSAIDCQRAVVELPDTVADADINALLAPLDGGQRVSAYLTVQDGVPTQRFDMV